MIRSQMVAVQSSNRFATKGEHLSEAQPINSRIDMLDLIIRTFHIRQAMVTHLGFPQLGQHCPIILLEIMIFHHVPMIFPSFPHDFPIVFP